MRGSLRDQILNSENAFLHSELDRENTERIESNEALEKQIDGLMAQNKNLMNELEKAKKFIADLTGDEVETRRRQSTRSRASLYG